MWHMESSGAKYYLIPVRETWQIRTESCYHDQKKECYKREKRSTIDRRRKKKGSRKARKDSEGEAAQETDLEEKNCNCGDDACSGTDHFCDLCYPVLPSGGGINAGTDSEGKGRKRGKEKGRSQGKRERRTYASYGSGWGSFLPWHCDLWRTEG